MGSWDSKKRIFMTEEENIELERLDKIEEQMNAETERDISKEQQQALAIDQDDFFKKHILLKEMRLPQP